MTTYTEHVQSLELVQSVAGNVRAEAARAGITQSAMAQLLQQAQSSVSLKWRGARAWTLPDLELIGRVLNVEPADFLIVRRPGNAPGLGVVRQQGLEPRTR